jgi:type I restriction enzyme S subunit
MANKLPKGWIIISLDDISTPPQYGWTTKSKSTGEIKYLRTTDITSKYIDWERVPYCVDLPEDLEKFLLEKNDIVISRAGSVGVSFIVSSITHKTVFASYLIRFKPLIVDPYYIFYFLKTSEYWDHISKSSAGIAVQNVNAQKLANLKIPLAPLKEQKRISTALDKLFSELNSIQTRLDNFPKFISEFRQQVLQQAVTGQLTKDWRKNNSLKKKWEIIRLSDHSTKIGSGSTPHGGQSVYQKKGIPLIRSMNVHFNGFNYRGLAFINNKQAYELRNVIVERDDVL